MLADLNVSSVHPAGPQTAGLPALSRSTPGPALRPPPSPLTPPHPWPRPCPGGGRPDGSSSLTLVCSSAPQAALLNAFPAIFDEVLQLFTVQEVAEFVRATLGSTPSTVHVGQSLDALKLQSIARLVDSRLFTFPGSRPSHTRSILRRL